MGTLPKDSNAGLNTGSNTAGGCNMLNRDDRMMMTAIRPLLSLEARNNSAYNELLKMLDQFSVDPNSPDREVTVSAYARESEGLIFTLF